MKSFAREEDRAELLARLRAVREDSRRRWGVMTAHQMVCHLGDAFLMMIGERRASDATGLLQRTLMQMDRAVRPGVLARGDPHPSGARSDGGWDEARRVPRGRCAGRGAHAARRGCRWLRDAAASDIRRDVRSGLDAVGVPAHGSPPSTVWRLRANEERKKYVVPTFRSAT